MLCILINLAHGGKWNASADANFKTSDAVITVVRRELYFDVSACKAGNNMGGVHSSRVITYVLTADVNLTGFKCVDMKLETMYQQLV